MNANFIIGLNNLNIFLFFNLGDEYCNRLHYYCLLPFPVTESDISNPWPRGLTLANSNDMPWQTEYLDSVETRSLALGTLPYFTMFFFSLLQNGHIPGGVCSFSTDWSEDNMDQRRNWFLGLMLNVNWVRNKSLL